MKYEGPKCYQSKDMANVKVFADKQTNARTSQKLYVPDLLMQVYKNTGIKGCYLDFSNLTELKNIYITEIYMKKQYKPPITKNKKIEKKHIFDGIPLIGYIAFKVIFRFCARNQKKHCWKIK